MRLSTLLSLSALVCCIPMASAPAQGAGVSINLRLGNQRTVSSYSSERSGDWRTNYKHWTPTTLYVTNGQYYDKNTRGSRAVVVYRKDKEYFLPPQDKKWVGADKRYNYKHRPTDEDYNRRP
jgi:hypothetical protein